MPSKRPKVCFQFRDSGTCTYGERCKFSHVVIPRASIERQRLDQTRSTKNKYIQEYFARYPKFEYDPSHPATIEFRNLCKKFRWGIETRNEEREAFHFALVKEFNGIYGTDEEDIKSWETLYRVLGIAPIPNEVDECRRVIEVTIHVNMIDLVNALDTITIFESEVALSEYTIANKKFFPRKHAQAGGFLQYLLRHIMEPEKGIQIGSRKSRRRTRRR